MGDFSDEEINNYLDDAINGRIIKILGMKNIILVINRMA